MSKCNFNSEYAYILNKINDDLNEHVIKIDDYLKNKDLQNEVKNKKKYIVCKEKHELIKYESIIKKSHFKHKTVNIMTDWHKEWQSNFQQIEIPIGKNIADVLIDDMIIEFQHSYISQEDVEDRYNNAIENNKILNWVIDCNDSIEVNQIGNIFMIYFYNETWKFEHFKCHEFIYLNIDDKIYKVNPNEIKSNMIDVIEYKTKNEFIKAMKNKKNIWSEEKVEQCILYHNQRGAGCGKTYESIQLMNIDDRFKHKQLFIFLTKAHTAKDVIYNELLEQYENGKLTNLEIPEETNNNAGKQYKISYYNKQTDIDCQIIIGTIDSFMYAIGDKNNKSNDYFGGIVKSIRNGYVNVSQSGFLKYSGNDIKLNKRCLIIIDEAQDLGPEYIEAICSIMRNTYIDAYTIGDKLQSIWGEHNIHTFLENNELPHIKTIKSNGKNHVMRFHNCQFKDFVNDIVKFEKHNLPPITEICNNQKCKYNHENDIKPYNIFPVQTIYSGETDETKVEKLVQQIINYMNNEINKYNYLPNNFMFIFPILSKNFLASRLEAKIQEFWIEKFNDINYQNNVLKTNKYWDTKINNNKYNKYVVLHKSDEGKSIDLRESENSTKILSIHASKGNGCEVVFLFGLTQNTLQLFSKDKCNLQYDSLLHVALTRQKKSLYVGIENNGDDICTRFEKFIEVNSEIKPNIDKIKTSIKYNRIIDYTINSESLFNKIFMKYSYFNELENKLPENNDNKNIVDWGHHLIRYCVFYYQLLLNIINNEHMDNLSKCQFTTVLNKISKLNINYYEHNEYYKKINEIKKKEIFPILSFDSDKKSKYYKYKEVLNIFIENIQKKISKGINKNKLPILCPLETVILLHMIKVHDDGKYSDITIMDIYSLIYYFDECSNTISKFHNNCKCLCQESFKENINNENDNDKKYLDIKNSIHNHYIKLESVNSLYQNLKEYIDKNLNNSKFEYNIFHNATLYNNDINFKISKNFELIAQSEKYVIDFIITPQLNKLNYNQIILSGIFNNFLLQNVSDKHENNCKRYLNKQVYTCILSLDSIEPLFINFNVNNNCLVIKNSIKEYIFNEYSENHKLIFHFYNYCKNSKPDNKNSIEYTYDKLVKESNSRSSDIPKYIENYFYDTNEQIKNCNKDKNKITNIMSKFNEINTFIESINEYLSDAINEYIENNNNEIIDF